MVARPGVLAVQAHPEFGASELGRGVLAELVEKFRQTGLVDEQRAAVAAREAAEARTDDGWSASLALGLFEAM